MDIDTKLLIIYATTLACESRNASLRALSLGVSRYSTTIEGVYNIYTYNISIL